MTDECKFVCFRSGCSVHAELNYRINATHCEYHFSSATHTLQCFSSRVRPRLLSAVVKLCCYTTTVLLYSWFCYQLIVAFCLSYYFAVFCIQQQINGTVVNLFQFWSHLCRRQQFSSIFSCYMVIEVANYRLARRTKCQLVRPSLVCLIECQGAEKKRKEIAF